MPYITKEKRNKVDVVVDVMKEVGIKADGDLNYILFKYCKDNIKPSYGNYKNFTAELEECAVEIRRRLTGPYENTMIGINGDV